MRMQNRKIERNAIDGARIFDYTYYAKFLRSAMTAI